jgi:hypothetical protein
VSAALAALAAAAAAARAGRVSVALVLIVVAGTLAVMARRELRLAGRNRAGAESEAAVRRELERLARVRWRVRHGLSWPGGGDLDHVVRAPSGAGFVIETKTLRFTRAHVVRTVAAAGWLARRRRRYPLGVVPVVCITRGRRVERVEHGALIVSLDRLLPALRASAASAPPAAAAS